jgi:hypothetical protein
MGKTQLEMELDASLGSGYLQRVESGKVKQPERETVERILAALGVRYTERREVLEMFGYVVGVPLPTPEESQWAAGNSQPVLDSVPFPAYLLDCQHRLIAWNRHVRTLFHSNSSASGFDRLHQRSMIHVLFDPNFGIANMLQNAESFYPATLQAFRYEMRQYWGEPWAQRMLAELMHVDSFRRYWEALQSAPLGPAPARPLIPIELDVPAWGQLKFRLSSELLSEDRRFRIIYYLPADTPTMQLCAAWSAT